MALAVAVRPAQPSDLEPLRWIIYRAYLEVLVQLYGAESATGYEVRSLEFMDLYLRRDPAGSLVAEAPGGALVGAVFCFAWGEVGWFGSLAVAPEWQGRGVGQVLTGRAVDYLAGQGCRRIGLETWPHSPLVRHLYEKFGFQPVRSTVKFSRPVAGQAGAARGAPEGVTWARGAGAEPQGRQDVSPAGGVGEGPPTGPPPGALEGVQAVTAAQARASPNEPRVDYREEVAVPLDAGWADLALLRDGAGPPLGFALCFLRRPGGGPVNALDVRLLGTAPGRRTPAALDRLLAACDALARRTGMRSVTVDVNLRHAYAAALLRERGFRAVYELLRMERPLPGFDPLERTPVVDCARWAG